MASPFDYVSNKKKNPSKNELIKYDYDRDDKISMRDAVNYLQQTTPKTYDSLQDVENDRPVYMQSNDAIQSQVDLSDAENKKPAEYQGTYTQQIDSLLNDILNRGDFKYNMNADPLYQQYKEQYTNLGNAAMQDTVGNAAALTGGLTNSYAVTAGNQAYMAYLDQLNNIVPELYNAAYNRYLNEGNEMYNNLNALQNADSTEYGKYRDTVGDYYNDLNYAYNKYRDMTNDEYNRYLNELSAWQSDRGYYYDKEYNQTQQENFLEQLALEKARQEWEKNSWQQEFDFGKDSWQQEQEFKQDSWQQDFAQRVKEANRQAAFQNKSLDFQKSEADRNYDLASRDVHSKDYDSVLSTAKGKSANSKDEAADYVSEKFSSGKITQDEAFNILYVLDLNPDDYPGLFPFE